MESAAISGRLRLVSDLLRERGVMEKGVDMSPAAVSARLRTLAALSDLCLRLAVLGRAPALTTVGGR